MLVFTPLRKYIHIRLYKKNDNITKIVHYLNYKDIISYCKENYKSYELAVYKKVKVHKILNSRYRRRIIVPVIHYLDNQYYSSLECLMYWSKPQRDFVQLYVSDDIIDRINKQLKYIWIDNIQSKSCRI